MRRFLSNWKKISGSAIKLSKNGNTYILNIPECYPGWSFLKQSFEVIKRTKVFSEQILYSFAVQNSVHQPCF
ncbi:hypothetical protein SAMN05421692_2812 [Chryseobacterium indologenes]|nr:hypothetical protein SAMN05421692_2812 [Chryseobacterium indologenes]SUX50984.1 Uncharacterised protein [Chryseobacterium indologenes]